VIRAPFDLQKPFRIADGSPGHAELDTAFADPFHCHGPMPFALNFVHPLLMWVLLGLMLYSGYLGYKASLIRKVSAEERKAMVPLHYGQRHAQFGAVIMGLTLLGAVGGMAATFLKNGKLILGPHLFVGLAVAVLVIATASLGPLPPEGQGLGPGPARVHQRWSAAVVRLAGLHGHRHRPEAAEFSGITNIPWHLIQ